jgi:chaperone required for assembly of F1-ATPase
MAHPKDPLSRSKRFYAAVSFAPGDEGFLILLDARPVRTPAQRRLAVPTLALAALIVEDWARQGEDIDLADMFATRLAFSAVDQAAARRARMAEEVVGFAGSDLLCYFAAHPQALFAEETKRWGPVLDWAEAALGLHFIRVVGVGHKQQPKATLARVRDLADALDDFSLAGLAHATSLFGSAVLALALQRGRLDGDTAFELSRLDEAFQERQWGADAEAAKRVAALRTEAQLLERWFLALR